METQTLYKFYWNCGRQGDLESVFISTPSEVEAAIGSKVYFGEVLGKHSEIYGTLDREDLTVITDDDAVIQVIHEHLNGGIGLNPLDHIRLPCGCMKLESECDECAEEQG